MNLPTDSWELIVHMIKAKLDKAMLRTWEQSRSAANTTLMALIDFLKKDVKRLREARDKEENVALKNKLSKHKSRIQEKKTALANVTSAGKVIYAKATILYIIAESLALTIDERLKEVC